jgi:hypothetical protein
MLAGMTDYFSDPGPGLPRHRRKTGQALGTAARVLLITAAVVLVVGGLAIAGCIVLLTVGLNSWASNK